MTDKRVRSMQLGVDKMLALEARIAELEAENAKLRKCVEAADALRFNDVGLPSSAKDAYDAARKALEEK